MARLILPNGRGHGWKRDTPDDNDYPLSRKITARKPIPDEYYLKPDAISKTRNQGVQGSCTGHAIVDALELSARIQKGHDYTLSPAFAYLQGRIIETSVNEDSGCECRDVVKAVNRRGVCLEKYLPYNDRKLATKASSGAYASANHHQIKVGYYTTDADNAEQVLDNMLQALLNDMPLFGGYSWYSCNSTSEFDNTGFLKPPVKGKDRLEGGHSNDGVGFDNRARVLWWHNSWDEIGAKHPKTGQPGFVVMPYEYVLRWLCTDNWAISHE